MSRLQILSPVEKGRGAARFEGCGLPKGLLLDGFLGH